MCVCTNTTKIRQNKKGANYITIKILILSIFEIFPFTAKFALARVSAILISYFIKPNKLDKKGGGSMMIVGKVESMRWFNLGNVGVCKIMRVNP